MGDAEWRRALRAYDAYQTRLRRCAGAIGAAAGLLVGGAAGAAALGLYVYAAGWWTSRAERRRLLDLHAANLRAHPRAGPLAAWRDARAELQAERRPWDEVAFSG